MKDKNISIEYVGSSDDAIITLVIGVKYVKKWHETTLPLWLQYCKRHDLSLISIRSPFDDPGGKRFDWQKFLSGKAARMALPKIKRVCYIDYDILPNPFGDNVFDEHVTDRISFVSQRKKLPYGDVNELLRSVAFWRNHYSNGVYPLDSSLTRSVEQIYLDHGLPAYNDLGCAGLFMFDVDEYSEYFEEAFYRHSSADNLTANAGEQVYLNHYILQTNKVNWIEYNWQALWVFECACNYPFLLSKSDINPNIIRACLINSLKKYNFLHMVGSWEKSVFEEFSTFDLDELNLLSEWRKYTSKELLSPYLGEIKGTSYSS